jgi:hypothetical protein
MNDERQRLPGQFTSTEVAAASKISEDPKHVDLWSSTPPKNSALETKQTPIGQQEHFEPSINATTPPIDQIGITVPERVSAWDHEIGIRHRGDAQPFRVTLTTGALIAALGLGWIGGSSSHRFFGPKQTANSSARILGSKKRDHLHHEPRDGSRGNPKRAEHPEGRHTHATETRSWARVVPRPCSTSYRLHESGLAGCTAEYRLTGSRGGGGPARGEDLV